MKKITIKALLPLLLTGLFVACGPKTTTSDEKVASDSLTSTKVAPVADERGFYVKVGDKAPDFTMKLTDGQTMKLSDYKGKVVMLQFTASWCGVCRKEMPDIEKYIWLKHKDNAHFALFGIDRDEPLETVVEFAKTTGITYPIGLDDNADIFSLYAEKDAGITRNVVVGEDGNIVMLTRLYNEEEFSRLVNVIDSLVAIKK